jgi:hypothetical protein
MFKQSDPAAVVGVVPTGLHGDVTVAVVECDPSGRGREGFRDHERRDTNPDAIRFGACLDEDFEGLLIVDIHASAF